MFHFPDGREKTLPVNSPVLFYLQRLRDEAHRFAIGAHRAKRSRAITACPLDEIPGIGPARKRALLLHFGTAGKVRAAALRGPAARAGRERGGGAGGLRFLPSERMTAWLPNISLAETPDEIAATWPVMHQLRPHLDAGAYLAQVLRLRAERDFQLARMVVDGDVVAVAGLRFGEWLHGGRYLEIEDFVTGEQCRSQGYGGRILRLDRGLGARRGLPSLRLLSGTHREAAHRFYRRKGMSLEAYYFSLDL